MSRVDGRGGSQLREVRIEPGVNPYAEGSAICCFGRTQVLCTASVEQGVPEFCEELGQGWITAEYAMLPRATQTRTSRANASGGRAREISRLIGRALRAAVDLQDVRGYTLRIDCDVLVADGGTRSAAITGGFVALAQALDRLGVEAQVQVAGISVGIVGGGVVVDLCYEEDSVADVDMNVVVASDGSLVEVQATAEGARFSLQQFHQMLQLARAGAQELFRLQREALGW